MYYQMYVYVRRVVPHNFRPLYANILYYEKVDNRAKPLESDSSYLNKSKILNK